MNDAAPPGDGSWLLRGQSTSMGLVCLAPLLSPFSPPSLPSTHFLLPPHLIFLPLSLLPHPILSRSEMYNIILSAGPARALTLTLLVCLAAWLLGGLASFPGSPAGILRS